MRRGGAGVGHEKLLRVYNVDKPEAHPFVFPEASGKIRCVAWSKSDDLLLTSDLDLPNITCGPATEAARVRGGRGGGRLSTLLCSPPSPPQQPPQRRLAGRRRAAARTADRSHSTSLLGTLRRASAIEQAGTEAASVGCGRGTGCGTCGRQRR